MNSAPVTQTLADLIRIKSVNPAYEDGVSEAGMATYVEAFFTARKIETWRQEVFPGRPNLIARIPGKNPDRRVILEAHTDTVSVKGMSIDPFTPRIDGRRMYGRGACDTKAGLAAMMQAVATVHASGTLPPCEIWLAAVADEEFSFRGVVKLCEGLKGQAALVAEPTDLRMVVASKGVLRWRIQVNGRAAHSSKPHLGVNAISRMAHLILALEQDHEQLAKNPHPLLGPATCNVGMIHGGVQVNFVPDRCCIEIDRRLLPGEKPAEVIAGYQARLEELTNRIPDFSAVQEPPMLVDESLETPLDSAPVLVAGAILREMGLDPAPCGVPFGSDASKLSRQGLPSLIFGPGSIDQAHAAVEFVELSEVMLAQDFFTRFIRQFE